MEEISRQGDYRTDSRNLFESNTDFQVRYHKNQIAGFLDLSALGGANVRSLNFTSAFESTNYLNTPGIYSFSNSKGTLTGNSFNSSLLVLSAYYSVDLGYKSYITANITGRGINLLPCQPMPGPIFILPIIWQRLYQTM